MKKKTVLCEMAFWNKFSECSPVSIPSLDEQTLKTVKTWIEIYSFLKRSDLLVDCTVADFVPLASKDERLAYLWQLSTEGSLSFNFNNQIFNLQTHVQKDPSIVLLSKENKKQVCDKFGIINIIASEYIKYHDLFINNGKSVDYDEEWDWKSIKKLIPERTSNSMVIVDNYIFGDGNQKPEYNLYRILDAILPDTCSLPSYCISFFYQKNKREPILAEKIERIKEELPSYIERIRPSLKNVIPEFFVSNEDLFDGHSKFFHDRAIITNNIWIDSGAGFSICRKEYVHFENKYYNTKSTVIPIAYPYFSSANNKYIDDKYETLINNAKEFLKRNNKTTMNRLLK